MDIGQTHTYKIQHCCTYVLRNLDNEKEVFAVRNVVFIKGTIEIKLFLFLFQVVLDGHGHVSIVTFCFKLK